VLAEITVIRGHPKIVMAGLDPAIHGVKLPPASTRTLHGQGTRNPVDARVEPGHGHVWTRVDVIAGLCKSLCRSNFVVMTP
jgi:hypothetical protein